MKNKLLWFLVLMVLLIPSAKAATKEDLYNLVDRQSVCDNNTSTLFEKYKVYYKRVVKTKELTSSQLDQIISNINYVLKIINQKSICKTSDLNKLTTAEKTNIYNALMEGTRIINNAPNISDNTPSSEKKDNDIIVNPSDKSIYIYDNGKLTEKITLDTVKLTYTGTSIYITIILIVLFIFLVLPIIYLFVPKTKLGLLIRKYRYSYNIVLYSLSITFIVATVSYLFANKNIKLINNITNNFKKVMLKENNQSNREIILDENKVIMNYPAIGDSYASLKIPSLGINNQVSFGDDQKLLKSFIGHYTGSYLPGEGGTIIYSGHNNKTFLLNLKNVKENDLITIETTYGTFNYIVNTTKIIKDTDWSSLNVTDNKETLILYTCYPFDSILYSNERFVVYAELVETIWKDN